MKTYYTRENQIKQSLRNFYGWHHKYKVTLKENTFIIKLGDCAAELEYPTFLKRQLKLEKIGILD